MRTVFIRFGGILFLAALAVWLYCLLDAVSSDRTRVRVLSKGAWVAIVLLTFLFGALALATCAVVIASCADSDPAPTIAARARRRS